MSTPLLHPTLDGVLAIHAEILGRPGSHPGLRFRDLLESALAAPQTGIPGTPLLSDPVEIAAAYLFFLGRNEAFAEGNKAAALGACLVFLSENGLLKNEELAVEDWESLTHEAAAGILNREEVTQKLRLLLS